MNVNVLLELFSVLQFISFAHLPKRTSTIINNHVLTNFFVTFFKFVVIRQRTYALLSPRNIKED